MFDSMSEEEITDFVLQMSIQETQDPLLLSKDRQAITTDLPNWTYCISENIAFSVLDRIYSLEEFSLFH